MAKFSSISYDYCDFSRYLNIRNLKNRKDNRGVPCFPRVCFYLPVSLIFKT